MYCYLCTFKTNGVVRKCVCGEKLEAKAIWPMLDKMLNDIYVVCNVPNCPAKKEEMQYSELISHLEFCIFKTVSCPQGCGFPIAFLQDPDGMDHY